MLEEIDQRTIELSENMRWLVQGIAAPRSRHSSLALPPLIPPTGGSQDASLPIATLNRAMGGELCHCSY